MSLYIVIIPVHAAEIILTATCQDTNKLSCVHHDFELQRLVYAV
jgi:hypothetical protein